MLPLSAANIILFILLLTMHFSQLREQFRLLVAVTCLTSIIMIILILKIQLWSTLIMALHYTVLTMILCTFKTRLILLAVWIVRVRQSHHTFRFSQCFEVTDAEARG